jgi:hypothetical protein
MKEKIENEPANCNLEIQYPKYEPDTKNGIQTKTSIRDYSVTVATFRKSGLLLELTKEEEEDFNQWIAYLNSDQYQRDLLESENDNESDTDYSENGVELSGSESNTIFD